MAKNPEFEIVWPTIRACMLAYEPTSPRDALDHVVNNLGIRWPEQESLIASDAETAWEYALRIVQGPWPEGEKAISSSGYAALIYARQVLKRPWPLGEAAMAKDSCTAYKYSVDVLGSRFQLGEHTIFKCSIFRDPYLYKWPDAKSDWAANGWVDWLE